MQSLKEFTIYTKGTLSTTDAYSILDNGNAMGFGEQLMVENAGFEIASWLRHRHKGDRMLFVVGTGGKGAIGLAAARRMLKYADVEVALVGNHNDITNKATRFNYRILGDIVDIHDIDMDNINEFSKMLKRSEDVIDSIAGIGIKGRLSSTLYHIIERMNESKKYVISIDMPSGMNADTGIANRISVNADSVLAIHKIKNGLLNSHYSGGTAIIDIGIPPTLELFAGPGDVKSITRPKFMGSNKYTNGSVLILGGSKEYHGAPILSSFAANATMAALRSNSGYVHTIVPDGIADGVSRMSTSMVVRSLPGDVIDADAIKAIDMLRHNVLALGPGLSQKAISNKGAASLLSMEKEKGNIVVIDASAIRSIALYKSYIGRNSIITPHEGEFKTLTGIDLTKASMNRKLHSAIEFADTYGCTLVLKGNETIITNGKTLKINKSSTPALATMGTGDVLTGMIASYAGMSMKPFESAVAAVYMHSKIGDMLFEKKGLHITAQDVIDMIPEQLKGFDSIM